MTGINLAQPYRNVSQYYYTTVGNVLRGSKYISYRSLSILAIETSCDDTAVALLEDKTIVWQKTYSPRSIHAKFGGIMPNLATELHNANLGYVLQDAIKFMQEEQKRSKPNLIAVTRGPGLAGSLACGVNTAKGLAVAWNLPLIGVHHMQAHALTPRLLSQGECPSFPYYSLLVSGGHTMLIESTSLIEHQILANTMDIAVGDSIDKISRYLGVPWNDKPPGAALEDFAKNYNNDIQIISNTVSQYKSPRPLLKLPKEEQARLFSFAGFLPSISNLTFDNENEKRFIAATVQRAIFKHVARTVYMAIENRIADKGITSPSPITLVVSGGVAANKTLTEMLKNEFQKHHLELLTPPVEYCGDNAAMIAWCAREMYIAGYTSSLDIDTRPKWPMNQLLMVPGWNKNGKAIIEITSDEDRMALKGFW